MAAHATSKLTLPLGNRDHLRGSTTARVSLLEYGDYECPHCGAAYPVVEELIDALGDRIEFAFRHFPLTQVHPYAEGAAEAAEAAGAQGKFWEMHHALFTNQDALDPTDLIAYASQIGLDLQRFRRDLADRAYQPRVREDFMSGVRSGVAGTPTFFINGLKYEGPPSFDDLFAILEEAASDSDR